MDFSKLVTGINKDIEESAGIHAAFEKYCGYMRLEDIFTTDSVYLCACMCASGFRDRPDTAAFMQSPWQNSRRLCRTVLSGKFVPKYYRERKITERGKIRDIKPPVFECKIVQKVLNTHIVRPVFEHRMIRTNYASVKGRGTALMYSDVLKALNRAGKKYTNAVIVMTDYRGYFASINNERLESIYKLYFHDPRIVNLLRSFSPEEYGLSLGNEVSQIPASFFPSSVDHYFKNHKGNHEYFRYMDDALCVLADMAAANQYAEDFSYLSCGLGLRTKVKMVMFGESFSFCKERYIFNRAKGYYYRLINPSILRNEVRKLRAMGRKLKADAITLNAVRLQYKGVRGVIKSRPNTWKALKRLDERYLKETADEEFFLGTSRDKDK